MKLKVTRDDFVVRERSAVAIGATRAAYRVYRLKKTSWDSFDLVDLLSRRLKMLKSDISLAGRKDRHGDAEQLIALLDRPDLPDSIEEKGFRLRCAGYIDHPLSAGDITGNHFRITLRDLEPAEVEGIKRNCLEVRRAGFVNYFDEQRFGSARAGRGFPGKALFLGRLEEALKIFLAPDGHEPAPERDFKKEAARWWRQWNKIVSPVPRRFAAVMRVLKEPGGYMAFNKAVNAIDRDLIIMALHAYQSYLWNRLAVLHLIDLEKAGKAGTLAAREFGYGELLFPESLPEDAAAALGEIVLPVPGHDTTVTDPAVRRALDTVLGEEGLALADLKVKKLHGKAVRGAERRLVAAPEEFAFDDPADDELYPGRKKLTLHFYLPRGCYATMLVRRIAGREPAGGRTLF